MNSYSIVWHYRDLRLHDNPALVAASETQLIPLYIHSSEDEGSWARGAASSWWLHHSLEDLAKQYQERGATLQLRKGKAKEVLTNLIKNFPIQSVYWNRRHEPALRARDEEIMDWLEDQGVSCHVFEGNYLISPYTILNKSDKPYCVYTPFSKRAMQQQDWRAPLPAPEHLRSPSISSEALSTLKLLPTLKWSEGFYPLWQPGRKGAWSRLQHFLQHVDGYGEKRDLPAIEGSSRLSPYLHFGELSPHEIWAALAEVNAEVFAYQRQLLWREFANYFLYHEPQFPHQSWRSAFEQFPWKEDLNALKHWQKGQSGYPIVDAGMRELWQTGWMHNRVRMIAASFLIKDLFIHWREGARWFWDTLVDADLANNSLGWQWVAGSGPDAAPYFRIFNPVLQGKKFDPEGIYVRRWIPELKNIPLRFLHEPWNAPNPPNNYPPPLVDHAKAREQALAAYKNL